MLKKCFIAHSFKVVNTVFVASFVIKMKKRQKTDKHFKLVTLASFVRCGIYVVRSKKIFPMAPNVINIGGSNR